MVYHQYMTWSSHDTHLIREYQQLGATGISIANVEGKAKTVAENDVFFIPVNS